MPEKIDASARVISNEEVAPGFWRMALDAPRVAPLFKPGQFFQIRIQPESTSPLLRRPFAPSEVGESGFAFVYAVVGSGTQALTRLAIRDRVEILGPLGQGFRLPRKGKRAVLVGGGCGAPSLRFLAEVLAEKGVEVFTVIGARTACALLEKEALTRISTMLAVSTDDGSEGLHGHAAKAAQVLLDEIGPKPRPELFTCGPHPMLKSIARLVEERKLSCQVSLEERMACGFGACMGCVVEVRDPESDTTCYKRVCTDGPVFDAQEICW